MANQTGNGRNSMSDEDRQSWRPQDENGQRGRRGTSEDHHERMMRDRDRDDERFRQRDRERFGSHWDERRDRDEGQHPGQRSIESYGQGQSGYGAGRYQEDRSYNSRNSGYPRSFDERSRERGVDDRFAVGRGGGSWEQERGRTEGGYLGQGDQQMGYGNEEWGNEAYSGGSRRDEGQWSRGGGHGRDESQWRRGMVGRHEGQWQEPASGGFGGMRGGYGEQRSTQGDRMGHSGGYGQNIDRGRRGGYGQDIDEGDEGMHEMQGQRGYGHRQGNFGMHAGYGQGMNPQSGGYDMERGFREGYGRGMGYERGGQGSPGNWHGIDPQQGSLGQRGQGTQHGERGMQRQSGPQSHSGYNEGAPDQGGIQGRYGSQGYQGWGGPSGPSGPGGPGGQRQTHRGKGPSGFTRSDDRIREMVCEALTDHDHIDATNIEITVKNGEVILSGFVDDRHQKRLAEDIAEQVSGVKDVQNQIRVGAEKKTPATKDSEGGADKKKA